MCTEERGNLKRRTEKAERKSSTEDNTQTQLCSTQTTHQHRTGHKGASGTGVETGADHWTNRGPSNVRKRLFVLTFAI